MENLLTVDLEDWFHGIELPLATWENCESRIERSTEKLIELFSPAYLPTFCLPLTQALGVEYVALVGDVTGRNLEHSDVGNRLDIRLGEEKLLGFAAA